jgi:hemolysin activation/secretion protein
MEVIMKIRFLSVYFLILNNIFASNIPTADTIQKDMIQNIEKENKFQNFYKNNSLPENNIQDKIKQKEENKEEITFYLEDFQLSGNEILSSEILKNQLNFMLHQNHTFSTLKEAIKILQTFYIDNGYIAKIYFPKQKLDNGTIKIEIIEAKRGEINKISTSTSKISKEELKEYFNLKIKKGEIFNSKDFAKAIKELNKIKSLNVTSSIKQSEIKDSIDMDLKADLISKYQFSTNFDNYGSKSLGIIQNYSKITVNDVSNYGKHDSLDFGIMTSKYSKMGLLAYEIPIGFNGLKLGLSISKLEYELAGEFKSLDIEGNSLTKEINLTYPFELFNEATTQFILSHNFRDSSSITLGEETSNKESEVSTIAFQLSNKDSFFNSAINSFELSISNGNLKLNNEAEKNNDLIAGNTNGEFNKLNLFYSREEEITDKLEFQFDFTAQKSFDNLDSGEKLSLGGPNSIRAYSSSVISGDNGYFYNCSLKYLLTQTLQSSIFYDYGYIKRNYYDWENDATLPNVLAIDSIGLGLSYLEENGFSGKIQIARKLDLNKFVDSNNSEEDSKYRIWITTKYMF